MSYILDALKKSEHQRRMGEIPHIHTQQEALPPDPVRANPWIAIAAITVIINLSIGAWLWWQNQHRPGSGEQAPAAPQAQQAPVPSAPPTATSAAPLAITPKPVLPQRSAPIPPQLSLPPAPSPVAAPPRYYPPPASPSHDLDEVVVFDNATAKPRRPPSAPQPVHDLVEIRDLPENLNMSMLALNMNVHVYDEDRNKRFVLIDMKRYAEGHALPQGPMVENITPDGVVLSYKGQYFQLTRN